MILGLAGFDPGDFDAARAAAALARIAATGRIAPPGLPELAFDPARDLVFDYGPPLPGHANGLVLSAWDAAGNLHLQETYYSIGGGFVLTARELDRPPRGADGPAVPLPLPHRRRAARAAPTPPASASPRCSAPTSWRAGPRAALDAGLARLWAVMTDCIDRGLAGEGVLPGGLKVRRRARGIHERLLAERGQNLTAPHTINDWISVYAIAVNEENAAGAQVVTAPTNGAAGRGAGDASATSSTTSPAPRRRGCPSSC